MDLALPSGVSREQLKNPPKSDFKDIETMSDKEQNRSRWLNTRLTEKEFLIIRKKFEKTTFQSVSEYSRSLLLGKPIKINYRNQSLDEMMEEVILMRNELNEIGNNFNQAVRKLNSCAGMPDASYWMQLLSTSKNEIEPCMRKIKDRMHEFAVIWSDEISKNLR